jgi:hypothetical protein
VGTTIGAAIFIVGLTVAATRIPLSSNTLRQRVVAALARQFEGDVTLEDLTFRLAPRLRAVGSRLVIRYQGRQDIPPLVSVRTFTIDASLANLWHRRVDRVVLEGLDITIPPRAATTDDRGPGSASEPQNAGGESSTLAAYASGVAVTRVEAPGASLTVLRRDPAKPPRVWQLHSLALDNVGVDRAMPFTAVLTNAIPPGLIAVSGSFGPWQRADPGRTSLGGRFSFDRADLSVFGGLAGTLSAEGTFGGTLDQIDVNGRTATPDFMVSIAGQPLPLTTTYHAIVDAGNGDTTLDPVDATFFNTSVRARGGIYDSPGPVGRTVRLEVSIEDGRLEDLMRLAVNTPTPPMTGGVDLLTQFVLPPGKADVVDKLQLEGRFAINDGHFTNTGVQQKVNDLSGRARGRPDSPGVENVTSDFKGRFALANGRLELSPVTFDVPGAIVELTGAYGLRRETLDFSGRLYMDAKLSQAVGGFKSLLLRLADPFFRKNGRTVVPLKIDGTRKDPHFGLDVKRVFVSSENGSKPAPAARNRAPAAPPHER